MTTLENNWNFNWPLFSFQQAYRLSEAQREGRTNEPVNFSDAHTQSAHDSRNILLKYTRVKKYNTINCV